MFEKEPQFNKPEEIKTPETERESDVLDIVRDFQEKNHSELEDLEKEAKEKGSERLELRLAGEQVYSKEFVDKLDDILEHKFVVKNKEGREEKIVLEDTTNKHLKEFSSTNFSNLSTKERAEKQREFVIDLGRGINKIPSGDPWSFYFDRIMEKGKINCSGSAALLGMVLENTKDKSGIKSIEYGQPYGHAVNMITFDDGRLYFADARNGMFEDISDYAKAEEKEGLKIYKIKPPAEKTGYQLIYHSVPVSSIKEGIAGSYLSNLYSAYRVSEGKFDDALKMGHSKKELKEIQKMASDVCRERGLSSAEQFRHLTEVKRFFAGNLEEYEESKEFKREKKRIEKIIGKLERG